MPDQVATKLTPEEITNKLFNKLKIFKLENDVLSVRELKGKQTSNGSKSKPITHSFILNIKSPQVCD